MFNGFLSCAITSGATVVLPVIVVDGDGDGDDDDDDDEVDEDDGFCAIFFVPPMSRSLKLSAKCFCLFNGCCAIGFTTDGTEGCAFTWLLSLDVFAVGDAIFDLPTFSVAVSEGSFLHFMVSCSIGRLL